MTGEEAKVAIYHGNLVECTKEEYETEVRKALQDQAAWFMKITDSVRAQICLNEVRRLDGLFDYDILGGDL